MKANYARFLFLVLSLTLSSTLFARAGGTPPDTELLDRVRSALSASIGPGARAIEVIATGGVVQLSGKAPSVAVRQSAVQAAERTPGVRAVDDRLTVGRGS
ncbi:MAG: BON domain-containing protein [Betaproteobacteria bacterium]|nr:BON domain-containing protein [Betaproteobacteria bacterium]